MRPSRFLFAGVVAFAALHGGACGSTPPPDPALADVVFEGKGDGRALDALLAATPQASPDQAAVIDSPTDGTVLPPTPQRFAWHVPALAAEGAAPGAAEGYFLLFSTAETPRLLRVFTTETSYTPDAKAWATISSAGIWTKLSVFTASFTDDALAPGGGPFEGTPIQFCVEQP